MISICIKNNDEKVLKYLTKKLAQSNFDEICFSKHSFKIYDNIIVHYKGKKIDEFYKFLGNVLTNIIIKFFEPVLIKKLINLNYFYFDNNDKRVVFEEYKLIRKNNKINKELISVPLTDFLKNNKSIVLTGFIYFRLTDYVNILNTLISESVNQYIVDKEYLEFVGLLKSYVHSKAPESSVVNLIYINSEGILLSDDGKIIDLESFDSDYLSDISFSKNDYVLNTLVGILPEEIVLHLISPRDQFIKTIELIFENRVKVCRSCELCKAYKMLDLN